MLNWGIYFLGGFLMAHVQKFSKGAIAGLSIHIERKTTNHANKDIDNSRSHLNYDLCSKEGDMSRRLTKRLSEVHCLNRADVKIMADWIVTLPQELTDCSLESQTHFFQETHRFLESRYGKDNVIGSVVHNDETTPHLHFSFVPVVFDLKKQRDKVSAKEVLTRKELSSFHQSLDTHLKLALPELYQGGILNNKTIGVEDVQMLKEKSKEIKILELQLDAEKELAQDNLAQMKELSANAEQQLYKTWEVDWLETKKTLPDFDMTIELSDYTHHAFEGTHTVDEQTPRTFSMGVKSMMSLIQEKARLMKEYLAEMLRSFVSKRSELETDVNVAEEELTGLKSEITSLNVTLDDEMTRSTHLQSLIETKTMYINQLAQSSSLAMAMPDYVKPSKLNKNILLVPKDKWEQKHVSANTISDFMRIKHSFSRAERTIEKHRSTTEANYELKRANRRLERDLSTYKNDNLQFWNVFADLINKKNMSHDFAKTLDLPVSFKQEFQLQPEKQPSKTRSKGLSRGMER